ncbi:MAG: methyl-accepting chemotaxis protein [Desulfococcaceae bacterium]|jgi:methyl-accepting chemotaxis protein|nr:methyl-accepting chemotaxis protein [Desulfococcaceae bacterium]
MKQSIGRSIFMYMGLFSAAVLILFLILAKIGTEFAGDFLIRNKMEQMESLRELKKDKMEDFFEERRKDMKFLVQSVETIRKTAYEKLESMQHLKKSGVEDYLKNSMEKLRMLSALPLMQNALRAFTASFSAEGEGGKSDFFGGQEPRAGDFLKTVSREWGFPALWLVSKEGILVYSTGPGPETGQNLLTGKLSDSPLSRCFQKALKGPVFQDFEPYASQDDFTAFMGAPVEDKGDVLGVLLLPFSVRPINDILLSREGMGKTGDTFLLAKQGESLTYRCTLAGSGSPVCELGRIFSSFDISPAFSGTAHRGIVTDDAGIVRIFQARKLDFPHGDWFCVSQMELEEIIAPDSGENGDFYTRYIREFAYDDLFLIRPDGNIIYSARYPSSLGTRVFSPPLSDTALSRTVRRVLEEKSYRISDYEIFAPTGNTPSAFIAMPLIRNKETELIAVLQLSADFMDKIMQVPGSTATAYLVGGDKVLRSRFAGEAEDAVVESESVRLALAGESGVKMSVNHKGRHVIAAYAPLDIGGFRWAILAETDRGAILSNTRNLKNILMENSKGGLEYLGGILILILLLLFSMARFLRRRVLLPLGRVTDSIARMAEYDLTVEVDSKEEDEVGLLLRDVNKMAENLKTMIAQVWETSDYLASSAEEISEAVEEQADIAAQQAASVTEISSTMEEFSASSAQIAENSDAVVRIAGKALEHTQNSVQSVEVLTKKMKTISENNRNNVREIGDLGKKSEEISKIMSFINHIADQTKLIAFNAAIEASGAGEAGKRFGVVAVEIRRLADSVTSSTGEIRAKIDEIQHAANRMVITSENGSKGIAEGIEMFEQTRKHFHEILSGAEETSNAARQISFSTQQQKTAATQVVSALRDIADGADQTSLSIQQISFIVSRLKDFSDNLQQLMGRFLLERVSSDFEQKIILDDPEEDSEWELI